MYNEGNPSIEMCVLIMACLIYIFHLFYFYVYVYDVHNQVHFLSVSCICTIFGFDVLLKWASRNDAVCIFESRKNPEIGGHGRRVIGKHLRET